MAAHDKVTKGLNLGRVYRFTHTTTRTGRLVEIRDGMCTLRTSLEETVTVPAEAIGVEIGFESLPQR